MLCCHTPLLGLISTLSPMHYIVIELPTYRWYRNTLLIPCFSHFPKFLITDSIARPFPPPQRSFILLCYVNVPYHFPINLHRSFSQRFLIDFYYRSLLSTWNYYLQIMRFDMFLGKFLAWILFVSSFPWYLSIGFLLLSSISSSLSLPMSSEFLVFLCLIFFFSFRSFIVSQTNNRVLSICVSRYYYHHRCLRLRKPSNSRWLWWSLDYSLYLSTYTVIFFHSAEPFGWFLGWCGCFVRGVVDADASTTWVRWTTPITSRNPPISSSPQTHSHAYTSEEG